MNKKSIKLSLNTTDFLISFSLIFFEMLFSLLYSMLSKILHIKVPKLFMKESEKLFPPNKQNFFMQFNKLRKIILNSL